MELIFLMKDYSVVHSTDIETYYKDIQFILFPCDPDANTYTLFEPNLYMIRMKKAKVIIESVAERCGYDYRDHYHPIGRVEKVVYSYTELIQYLFSIDKIKMYNSVMGMSEVRDIPPYIKILFCFFSVRLYDEHNKVIFKKKINIGEEVQLAEIHISKIFGPGNILNNIRDIYFQELSLFKEHISIDPVKKRWDLGHDKYKYQLCAYWMDETNSITFFDKEDIKLFKSIRSFYGSGSVFLIDHSEKLMWNYPEYDLVYFDEQLIVEYLTYLPYINLAMKMCAKVANVSPGKPSIEEEDIEIYSHIEIEIRGKTISKRFKDYEIFTISDLIKLLQGEA